MKCQGKKIKGSGYTKPAITNNSLGTAMQKLLAEREAQDTRYFPSDFHATVVSSAYAFGTYVAPTVVCPVEPNPPAPRAVSGPGSDSRIYPK